MERNEFWTIQSLEYSALDSLDLVYNMYTFFAVRKKGEGGGRSPTNQRCSCDVVRLRSPLHRRTGIDLTLASAPPRTHAQVPHCRAPH